MKKLVVSLILGASLAIVPSAFALKAMTSDSMKDTTGQAGVSLGLDNVTIFSGAGTTMYIDNIEGASVVGGGAILISSTGGFTTLRGILDNGNRNGFLRNAYGDLMAATTYIDGTGTETTIKNQLVAADGTIIAAEDTGKVIRIYPLTIDVTNALQSLSAGRTYNGHGNVAGISIGLPTLEICKAASTKTYRALDMVLGAGGADNHGAAYITVTKTASTCAILGGTIEIAPH